MNENYFAFKSAQTFPDRRIEAGDTVIVKMQHTATAGQLAVIREDNRAVMQECQTDRQDVLGIVWKVEFSV